MYCVLAQYVMIDSTDGIALAETSNRILNILFYG